MIRANELRIGNLVLRRREIKAILEIYEVAVRVNIGPINVSVGIESIEPIPLSPEWLERCGFKEHKTRTHTEYHLPGFTTPANFTDIFSKWYDFEARELVITATPYDEVVIPCQHIHQLQNLYYTLTGTELTIS